MLDKNKAGLSKHDAQIMSGVGAALVKTGIAATALVAAGPAAAVSVTLATELAGVILESKKQRMATFAQRFSERTAELPEESRERVREQLRTESGSRIFETAWEQAAQEVEPDKIEHIATLLANSLTSDVLDEYQARRLLKILGELDSVQIILLRSFVGSEEEKAAYKGRHASIFQHAIYPSKPEFKPNRHYSLARAPITEEEKAIRAQERAVMKQERDAFDAALPTLLQQHGFALERHALHTSRIHELVDQGLLGVGWNPNAIGDKAEAIEAVTPLGMALLKIIDAVDPLVWGEGEQVNTLDAINYSAYDVTELKKEYDAINERL